MAEAKSKDGKKAMQAVKETMVDIDDAIKYLVSMQQFKKQLGNVSDEQALKLKMLMDQHSKMMETLSNTLKKLGDTQNSIVKNMK